MYKIYIWGFYKWYQDIESTLEKMGRNFALIFHKRKDYTKALFFTCSKGGGFGVFGWQLSFFLCFFKDQFMSEIF